MVIITEINKAIKIIDFIPAPAHIIIIGPKATLGKLFKIVRYGSITLAKNLLNHIIVAINIPIIGDEKISITAMYMGKDKDGRYNFTDNSRFIFSREFLEKGTISIEKEFDGDKAIDIHANIKRKQDRIKKSKGRDSR